MSLRSASWYFDFLFLSGKETSKQWRDEFLSSLSSGLREQQRSGKFCDVTISVEGVSFLCHKAVLCSVSPYFSAMFAHDMKESRDCVVKLPEMTSSMFERVLDCIYGGEDIVNGDNAQDVLEVATLMQMDVLQNRVEEYFKDNLALDNFVDIWYLAKKYSCTKLEQHIWRFMLENFLSLFQSGDLGLLPMETFEALLCDDGLNVSSEDVVCEAALQWMNADSGNRLKHIHKLIKAVRLPLCSPEYVLQRLNTDKSINQVPEVASAVQEALKYKMYTARKHDFTSVQTTQRSCSSKEDVMAVIGGTDNLEHSGSGMRCYSFQRETWFDLPSLPQNIGPYYACCTYGDDIYVSGGQYHREAFHRFQASTCTWTSLPKLPIGRFLHGMACSGDVIYAFGGETDTDDKTIFGYQIQSGVWDTYGELLDSVNNTKAVVVGQGILIFGSNGNSNASNVIQYFDVLKRQVTRVNSITLPGIGCQTVLCGEIAYVISLDGKVIEITNDLTTKEVTNIVNFNPKRFGVIQYRGKLLYTATSGLPTDNERQVMVFDLAALRVDNSISIPGTNQRDVPWLGSANRLSCTKITIGKHHLKEI